MNYWLVKSEPSVYSWEEFLKDGRTVWDGVRNYTARMHLNAMKKGDEVMYYHSREGLEVVGVAKVLKESYQDPTTDDERWVAVDLKPVKTLKKSIPLSVIKQEKKLANIGLVKIGRLSVMPLSKVEFNTLLKMGS